MADDITQLTERMSELLTQAQRAENSLGCSVTGIKGAPIRTAQYRGTRELTLSGGAAVTMHAIALDDWNGKSRDVMFCRTPELAKFVALLLRDGEVAVAALYKSLTAAAGALQK